MSTLTLLAQTVSEIEDVSDEFSWVDSVYHPVSKVIISREIIYLYLYNKQKWVSQLGWLFPFMYLFIPSAKMTQSFLCTKFKEDEEVNMTWTLSLRIA